MEDGQPRSVGRMSLDIGNRILILSFAAVGLNIILSYLFIGRELIRVVTTKFGMKYRGKLYQITS